MKRRDFLLGSTAFAVLALPQMALAAPQDYKPGLVDDLLKQGKTVFVDFKASWCTTCRAQERVLTQLKADNPAYEKSIAFVNVDWDDYQGDALTKRLKIPRRSTLVVLKGDKELGRIVAQTSTKDIQGLMDIALTSATS